MLLVDALGIDILIHASKRMGILSLVAINPLEYIWEAARPAEASITR